MREHSASFLRTNVAARECDVRATTGAGDRNVVSWGAMVADAQSYLALAWWTSLFPGLALAVLILALNLLGDGLADAWNVRGADRT